MSIILIFNDRFIVLLLLLLLLLTQLTSETVEEAAMLLAEIVDGTVGDENEQDSAVLDTTANYLTNLATFLNNSNENISSTVSIHSSGVSRLVKLPGHLVDPVVT